MPINNLCGYFANLAVKLTAKARGRGDEIEYMFDHFCLWFLKIPEMD